MNMMTKQFPLIPLFEEFVKSSYKGKRLKADGTKIKRQTVRNYEYIERYLKEYELKQDLILRIRVFNTQDKKIFTVERNYWKKFYLSFTQFLYSEKNCYDNYVGTVIKTIRIFFNYLNREKGIPTGEFYKYFYVCK